MFLFLWCCFWAVWMWFNFFSIYLIVQRNPVLQDYFFLRLASSQPTHKWHLKEQKITLVPTSGKALSIIKERWTGIVTERVTRQLLVCQVKKISGMNMQRWLNTTVLVRACLHWLQQIGGYRSAPSERIPKLMLWAFLVFIPSRGRQHIHGQGHCSSVMCSLWGLPALPALYRATQNSQELPGATVKCFPGLHQTPSTNHP